MHRTHIEAKILAGSEGLREISLCDYGNRQAGLDFLARLLPALRELEKAATSPHEGGHGR